jgi:hypothetical protein
MYFQNLRRRLPANIKTISREGVPLVTLEEGRNFLRSRLPGDDEFINRTIMAVQRNIEAYAGIRVDEGTFDAFYDSLANELELKDVPATITNVYYTNQDGTEVLMVANTDYVVFTGNSLTIKLKPEGILSRWIDNEVLRPLQYRVRYDAGHEDLSEVWPQVKTAMEHELAFYFKNRQDGDQQAVVISGELTIQAKNMLAPLRERQ